MTLSAVLVTDTRPPSVEQAVGGLADALDAVGDGVEVVIVDSSGDALVADFLRRVEGATVLPLPGATRMDALLAGARAVSGDRVWLGGSESCPAPSSMAALDATAAGVGGLAVAAPEQPGPNAVVPLEALQLLARHRSRSDSPGDPVPVLLTLAAQDGVPIGLATGAGARRARVRESRQIEGNPHVLVPPHRWTVGPATYSGPNTLDRTYGPLDSIEVGGYCSIADEVRIILPGGNVFDHEGRHIPLHQRGNHKMEYATTFPLGILVPDEPYDEPPPGAQGERLLIGDDVWIGVGARILGSVRVGTGAVVGAAAVVVGDVPPYAVVGGVPAKVIRQRFDRPTVERLLRVAWWDWPFETVRGAHRWFGRPIAEFLRHFDPGSEVDPDEVTRVP